MMFSVDVDNKGHVTVSLRERHIQTLLASLVDVSFDKGHDVGIRFLGTHEYALRLLSYHADMWVLQVSNEYIKPKYSILLHWEDTVVFDDFEEALLIAVARFIKLHDQFGHDVVDIKVT